jgi:hypothetical protein
MRTGGGHLLLENQDSQDKMGRREAARQVANPRGVRRSVARSAENIVLSPVGCARP